MLKKKIMFIIVISLLLLPTISLADDILVTKTAPDKIKFGDNLNVTITITNNLNQAVTVNVKENIGDAQSISPQLVTPQTTPGIIAARPPYFEWNLNINANSQNSVAYTIKPNKVGYYLFSPTIVTTTDGKIFYSNKLSTFIQCNSNNVCEPQYGEDYTNCPSDCAPPGQNSGGMNLLYIIGGLILVIVIAGFLFVRKKQKTHKPHKKR